MAHTNLKNTVLRKTSSKFVNGMNHCFDQPTAGAFKGVWWIRLLKMRITCNFDRTSIIAYLNYGSNLVTLQNLKPEKLIIENNM